MVAPGERRRALRDKCNPGLTQHHLTATRKRFTISIKPAASQPHQRLHRGPERVATRQRPTNLKIDRSSPASRFGLTPGDASTRGASQRLPGATIFHHFVVANRRSTALRLLSARRAASYVAIAFDMILGSPRGPMIFAAVMTPAIMAPLTPGVPTSLPVM
jgi:hypothetical protein